MQLRRLVGGQVASHDGVETIDHVWIRPEQALEDHRQKNTARFSDHGSQDAMFMLSGPMTDHSDKGGLGSQPRILHNAVGPEEHGGST